MLEVSDGPSYTYRLGDAPPVTCALPTGQKFLDLILWRKAYELTIITRQSRLTDEVCGPATAIARCSGLDPTPGRGSLSFISLMKELWRTPGVVASSTLADCQATLARLAAEPGSGTTDNRLIWQPYYAAIAPLADGNQDAIGRSFENALEAHKEYWSATAELRKNIEGVISLPLTALAALAWDRGLRFHVESDYLPWSWVTGDVFRPAAPAS
jgi:hypothetical protein